MEKSHHTKLNGGMRRLGWYTGLSVRKIEW